MVRKVLTAETEKGAGSGSSASSVRSVLELLPVVLDPRRAQAGEAMLVDGQLPAEELLGGQRVALAGFLKAEKSTANGGNDFGLAADNPATGAGGRQVGNRQGTAIRPNDILDPWAVGFGHDTLTQKFNDL